MRRFTQRQHLVTLSDINITPLLDLAFVLLIIFIITTPLLEQGIELNLPQGGSEDTKDLDPRNVWTIEVSTNGWYFAKGGWRALPELSQMIYADYTTNRELLFFVRADEITPYRYVAGLLNNLEKMGIERVSLRTELPK